MQHGAAAYASTAKVTAAANPRELEAHLLLKAATKLQACKDGWSGACAELDHALIYNRKLWVILATAVVKDDNPLPLAIKNNIANLAGFIFKRTLDIDIEPQADKLNILISINRNIAAGLSGRG